MNLSKVLLLTLCNSPQKLWYICHKWADRILFYVKNNTILLISLFFSFQVSWIMYRGLTSWPIFILLWCKVWSISSPCGPKLTFHYIYVHNTLFKQFWHMPRWYHHKQHFAFLSYKLNKFHAMLGKNRNRSHKMSKCDKNVNHTLTWQLFMAATFLF